MLHSMAPGIPLPRHTHIGTLINHEYTRTIGEAICSLFSAAITAQIEWSVWGGGQWSNQQTSRDKILKDAIPGDLLVGNLTAEPSHIKTGAVREPLCYQRLNEIY